MPKTEVSGSQIRDSSVALSAAASPTGTADVTGVLPVGNGGTGVTTLTGLVKGTGTTAMVAATAGTDYVVPGGALGTPTSGTLTNCTFPTLNQSTTGTAANVTGTVAVANGGTGSTTLALNNVLLGNATGTLQAVAPGSAGSVLTSNGTTWTSAAPSGGGVPGFTTTVTSATAVVLTSASTEIQEFTGSTAQTVRLPSTDIVAGRQFTIINNSSALLTMQTSTSVQIHILAPGTESILTALVATPTTAAQWEDSFIATSFAAGKALTINNTLTLAGTDGTTMTFPGATDTVVTLGAAQSLTSKTLTTPTLTTPVINGVSTGTGVATAGTASTLALRDANANITADNFISVVDSTATAGTITTLTIASGGVQVFTGTAAQTVVLPTTSVTAGMSWMIINNSTGTVSVASSGGNAILTPTPNGSVKPSTAMTFTALVATPTTAAHWTAAGTSDATRQNVPRSISTASTGTPTINSDTTDFYFLTALAVPITAITITGLPNDGQTLTLRIKDNGTARAIAWSSAFTSSGVAVLPTTTVANKTHLIGLMYDTQAAKWVCVASDSVGY